MLVCCEQFTMLFLRFEAKIKKDAMENMLKQSITKEEIEKLPLFVYDGEIVVVEDEEQVDAIAESLRMSSLLGFDTETRPAFHKGEVYKVGLLQLATPEVVYLFRLNKCGFPTSLQSLLADSSIIKIGVGIRDDIRNLRKQGDFMPASFVDLQEFAEKFGILDKSFSKLMAIIFGVKISKRQRVTNWDAPQLSDAQIHYAATDAWGALKMYQHLVALKEKSGKL